MRLSNLNNLLVCAGLMMAATVPSAIGQGLSAKDIHAARLSGEWRNGCGLVTRGADGKVIFLYGEVQPTVICAPLQVCDIELQAGETVRNVMIGDTVRWKVEPATSGASGGEAVHLIVKPAEPGLQTSMVVTTSRRTYHIGLKSHQSQYMARIGFDYPQDVNARFAAINKAMEASIMPGTGMQASRLDFGFHWSGSARFRPTRIYSDGEKTYIQFPPSISGQDAPVLYAVSGGENRIVNYRMTGTMMVVDYRIDKAILVSGAGGNRQTITIRRGG